MTTYLKKVVSATRCLKEIKCLPIDFDQALFANYPAMKLGLNTALDTYVAALTDMALNAMSAHPSCKDWILTAPPFIALPSAANLLCWKVEVAIQKTLPTDHKISVLDLHYASKQTDVKNECDFKLRYEYSNNSVEKRIKERSRLQDNIHLHQSNLAGKGVIIINDIKVTGTQQVYMTQSFNKVKPACLEWLYIFSVDDKLGAEYPEIEHQINSSRLQTLDQYQQLICADETTHTARCISRLFSHNLDDFKRLVTALKPKKRIELFALVDAEKRFNGHFFSEKYSFLKQHCGSLSNQ